MRLSQNASLGVVKAPTGGWNARDPLSSMSDDDAIVLDNMIPSAGGVELRNGYASHVTGNSSAVLTLMEYRSPTTNKLFAATADKIYDVTSAGSIGAASVSSLTNGLWQHTMMATSGGHFLVACNGADAVRNYNGSTWSTPTITGATSTDLIHVMSHQSRLWFIEKNSLSVWYLGTASISGAASEIDLGAYCKKGGSLIALGSWTRDGGSGSDDVAVFITTKGEVLLFSGTDPSDAATWALVGVFSIPEPIGRRCIEKVGAELVVITLQGAIPLSTVLPAAASEQRRGAITDKISGAFQDAYLVGGALNGWQVIEYPKGGLLLVNVPSSTGSLQFVMNSLTRAWCRFTGIDARCWALLGDDIYFAGDDGVIYKYGTVFDDDGDPIQGTCLLAFTDFGRPGVKKHIRMARPLFIAPLGTVPPLTLRVDYDTTLESLTFLPIPSVGTDWDEGDWDESSWGPAPVPVAQWQPTLGIGQVCTVLLAISALAEIKLFHTDISFETGGVL